MIYKQSKGPRGRKLYFAKDKGGFKMVAKSSIPEDILATMELEKPIDDTLPEFRKCIFCGELGTERKLINGQGVDVCLEDYYSKTTGEIVEQLRDKELA